MTSSKDDLASENDMTTTEVLTQLELYKIRLAIEKTLSDYYRKKVDVFHIVQYKPD